MTNSAKRHAQLAKVVAAFDAGQATFEALKNAYRVYANGTYGLDRAGLIFAARTCAACAPRNHFSTV